MRKSQNLRAPAIQSTDSYSRALNVFAVSAYGEAEFWLSGGKVILLGMDTFIPHNKKGSHSNKPWFDEKCSEGVSEKQRAYKQWQKHHSTENDSEYILARNKGSANGDARSLTAHGGHVVCGRVIKPSCYYSVYLHKSP